MKLYVDDVRPIPDGWTGARTVEEAVRILESDSVEELSLDYMIGDSPENNFSPVARFVVTLPPEKRPRLVRLHTSSPSGARVLESILRGHVGEILFG
jgi:hypothetical protein